MMRIPRFSYLVLSAILIVSASGALWAQAGTGELTGLVSDPTGAVLSGASVELTNSQTGLVYTTQTSTAGMYRFVALPIVGTYALTLQQPGFKAVKIAGIVISVGTTSSRDIKLEIGGAGETVTVEAGAEVVQTTESSLSTLVDRNIWQSMPLEVRNQNSFIELVAGAAPQADTNNNRGAAVNGAREGAGNYLVEGMTNYEQGQAGRGQISIFDQGGAAVSISPDAIQEYRVITNNFAAEYGQSGGFVTDTVLKSGTNKWHGSAFEYNRIQDLAANDFFSNRAEVKDHLVRNQFGGALGGPIYKDKAFFYGVGEIHRARQSSPITTTSTTSQFLDFVKSGGLENWAETSPNGLCNNQSWWDNQFGDGSAGSSGATAAPCPGRLALSNTTGSIFNTLYAKGPYPLANSGPYSNIGAGYWTSGLTYPVPVYGQTTVAASNNQNEERFSIKFDQIFSDKDKFSAIYLYQNASSLSQYVGGWNVIGPAEPEDGRGQSVGLTWNHSFTPSVLNTARFGYLRHRTDFPPPAGALGIPQYGSEDSMGVDFGLYSGLPQWFTENVFQYQDSLSFMKGKHSFKTGVEYRRIRNGSTFDNDRYSSVYSWGIEDTMTDLAFSDQVNYIPEVAAMGAPISGGAYYMSAAVDSTTGNTPNFYRGYRANEFGVFFQDDWRVKNNLTVNLGLRWDYFGPPHNFQSNIDSNFYFGSTSTPVPTATNNPFFPSSTPFYAGVATGGFKIKNSNIWNKDPNNFAPRLGFAWDPKGNQKFVVRGGFGIAYDRIYNNVFENIRFNPPYFSDNQIGMYAGNGAVGPISSPGLLTYPFSSLPIFNSGFAPKPNPRHMNQDIVTPYYEQTHFGVQWEFAKGYVFEPEYVGTFGHKLIGLADINTFDGRTIAGVSHSRINTHIGADNYRYNCCDSNYHGLQLTLRKAYSTGVSFNVNYTYSKALDDMSDLFNNRAGGHPTDNMSPQYDYGPADFDLRHRFVATISYQLPFKNNNRWLGGWGVNSILAMQTGHPFSPFDGSSHYDLNKDGYYTDRVVPVNGRPMSTVNNGVSPAGDPNNPDLGGYLKGDMWETYTCPAGVNGGAWCNPTIGRGSVTGPGFKNVDFNITKKFKVTESKAFTFQANFFDLFNHPNFRVPVADLNSSSFGLSQLTLGDNGGHRVTQLALRFDF